MGRGRGTKNRQGAVSILQRMADRARHERHADVCDTGAVVLPFAEQHGDYVPAAKSGEMRKAMRNRGGTTLDRWEAQGLLSETQLAGIWHVQALWRNTESGARLVANLDRTVFGCPGDGHPAEIEARHDLHRIQDGFPKEYWDIFEDVCRWDEPAGTAGSRLANFSRSANEAARLTVCLIADMIYMRERLSY